jgi:Ca2+-transporting ATPase
VPPSFVTDKTGTLTQNKMSLQSVYALAPTTIRKEQWDTKEAKKRLKLQCGSEPVPLIQWKNFA